MKNRITYNYGGVRLKLADSMTKVFYDEEPAAMTEGQELQAFRGECVSFQVVYTFEGCFVNERYTMPFKFVRVRAESPLQEYVHVRSVCNVPCQYPVHEDMNDDNYLRKEPGLYPDRLSELEEGMTVFQRHQWKSLWVDLEIPEDAEPGIYPVKIVFEDIDHNTEFCSIETEIEIFSAVLPKQTLIRTEWFHVDCLADYYHTPVFSEENWRIIENFIAAAAKRGINMMLTPQFTPPLDTAVGRERTTVQLVDVEKMADGYAFDFTKLIRWIEICRKHGIRYIEMSHLFSQWGAVAAPKIVAKVDGELKELFGWNTPATGGAYTEFLHAYLPQLRRVLQELGVEQDTYFHMSDEPQLRQIDSYRAAYESVAKELEGCNFLEALSDYEFYRTGLVSHPVCATNHIQPYLDHDTPGLWAYYCTAQSVDVSNRFIAMPLGRTRIYGVQLFKFGIEGMLHWGYNFYNGVDSMCRINPYQVTDCCGAYPAGDPFLVYPREDGMPEESIRMMVLDEAMNDVRALNYLSELIGRDKVLEMVDEGLKTPLTFDQYPAWPKDREYLARLRRRVNDAICSVLDESKTPQQAAVHPACSAEELRCN